jgi:plastocyanin
VIEEIPARMQELRGRAGRGTLHFLATLGTLAMLVLGAATLAHGADGAVSIVDFAFQPATITIDAGGTVTWTVSQAQDPHTVSPVDPPDGFVGSPLLRQSDHFSVTFAEAGTYRYQCTIHPEDMRGTVIVQAAQTTPSPTVVASPTATGATTTSAAPATDTPAPTGSPAPQEPSGGAPPPIAVVVAAAAVLAAAGVAGWFLVMRRTRA